jgi:hypothetical protein
MLMREERAMPQRNRAGHIGASIIVLTLAPACVNRPALLHQLIDARRLAADMHVQFSKAVEASHRAVMAATDETSAAAGQEARQARSVVARDLSALEPLIAALAFSPEMLQLNQFKSRFEEYQRLDDDVLSLAVENTNIKAQRLAFGPAREAAEAFRRAIAAAVSTLPRDACDMRSQAAAAVVAVLEIEVLQPPHIAESDEAAMTRMEDQMAQSEAVARAALGTLQAAGDPQPTAAASEALARFETINTQIVTLSRRNSNVRSLALSLGRKRTLTAECEDHLSALEEALAGRELGGTR